MPETCKNWLGFVIATFAMHPKPTKLTRYKLPVSFEIQRVKQCLINVVMFWKKGLLHIWNNRKANLYDGPVNIFFEFLTLG